MYRKRPNLEMLLGGQGGWAIIKTIFLLDQVVSVPPMDVVRVWPMKADGLSDFFHTSRRPGE